MLDQIVRELEKEGYCYLPKLLPHDQIETFNAFIEKHKFDFTPARVGTQNNKQRVEAIRGDYTYWLDPLEPKEPFMDIFTFLHQLKEKLNKRFFLGLQEFECHLAFYPPGTFYKKHLDRFEKNSSRRISFIFYLNKEWNETNGGELVLFDQQGSELKTFYPLPGSFICFLSDEYPHEVKSSNKERRSLTGWIHTKKIY